MASKYAPLTQYLQNCGQERIRLTFSQINTIVSLPPYAYANRPAWANVASQPTPLCGSWMKAGYEVAKVDLQAQWVEFCKKGTVTIPVQKTVQADFPAILQCGYDCFNGTIDDPNHRYLSWEYCHRIFKQYRKERDAAAEDLLCLHLAWYLASWGMLRNSFLMQKDYKIHLEVVRLIYQPEWDDLWDMTAQQMVQPTYAKKVVQLCKAITDTYIRCGAGNPTETLLTKVLLGTIACAPAYDRYFKAALSLTKIATQNCSAKSLMSLGNFYLDHKDELDALAKHCSQRIDCPAAKVLDMCFFEYGLQHAPKKEQKK